MAGGCCGTTPDHIHAIAEKVAESEPRKPSSVEPAMRLSGLEHFEIKGESTSLIMVGESKKGVCSILRFLVITSWSQRVGETGVWITVNKTICIFR